MDSALSDFSGYLAIDELYDGPFCVLSAVDSPKQRRLLYEVLDHDPDHDDIRRFLGRLEQAIVSRGRAVAGITTDGSALSLCRWPRSSPACRTRCASSTSSRS